MPHPSSATAIRAGREGIRCIVVLAFPSRYVVVAHAPREEVAAGGLDVYEVRPIDLDVGKVEPCDSRVRLYIYIYINKYICMGVGGRAGER